MREAQGPSTALEVCVRELQASLRMMGGSEVSAAGTAVIIDVLAGFFHDAGLVLSMSTSGKGTGFSRAERDQALTGFSP